jgi:hypothetical protein
MVGKFAMVKMSIFSCTTARTHQDELGTCSRVWKVDAILDKNWTESPSSVWFLEGQTECLWDDLNGHFTVIDTRYRDSMEVL